MATQKSTQRHVNRCYLLTLLLLLAGTTVTILGFTGNGDYDLAKQQILLRNIGHEVLLHSGDSTSRVLPVREIAPHEYQIRFEHEWTFQPDSLVEIIRQSLKKDQLADEYIVNVINCTSNEVLFGYAISGNEQNNIVPCKGRKQPTACYLINIRFNHASVAPIPKSYWVAGISLFAFIGLLAVRPFWLKKPGMAIPTANEQVLQMGNTQFEPGKRKLTAAGITVELTPKENKILNILFSATGELIERNRLQKEIWEDEGVIVGRSLDVFISKLRKKLENDPSIVLVNVHGKGYRLQINSSLQDTENA